MKFTQLYNTLTSYIHLINICRYTYKTVKHHFHINTQKEEVLKSISLNLIKVVMSEF